MASLCPVCAHTHFKLYRHVKSQIMKVPAGLDRGLFVEARIERCAACGLLRTIPLSDLRSVDQLYANDSVCFSASASKHSYGDMATSSTDELSLISVGPPAKLLDVGCGAGYLLQRAERLGFNVFGLDLDVKAVQFVRDELHLSAHCGTLDTLGEDQKFDVITMMGILEHLENPRQMLAEVAGRLNVGGELILGVPNVRSLNRWISRCSQHDWDMFLEPGHLYHYDMATLRSLAQTAGFRLKSWVTSTMAIRGKIPFMPTRYPELEARVSSLVGNSPLFRKFYLGALRALDAVKAGDMLFASFERSL